MNSSGAFDVTVSMWTHEAKLDSRYLELGQKTVECTWGGGGGGMMYWTEDVSYQVKAVSLQAWSGPEGSRKLSFPDYMKTAQDGGKVVSLTRRPPLPPGNAPGTHFC
jgi:hypothetical protein